MGSNGRAPPPLLRRPHPGPGMMHPDPFGPSVRPPPGAYPPFDMLPPPEVLEQKLALQHAEIQRLATENQRLSVTHVALRQELAAAQQELQRVQAQVGAMKHGKEQQMRGLVEKIAKIEVDLQAAEPIKLELQKARADAQSLIAARQELISKVQQLTHDNQSTLSDVQQIPALMSELEDLRQKYHHYRATYDYEKKLYDDHSESLQGMEKNYISMAREVEKLRAELANAVNIERRTGAPYGDQSAVAQFGASTGYNKVNEAGGHQPVGQDALEDGYNVSQGRGALNTAASSYGEGQAGSAPARGGYDAPRGPGYDAPQGFVYESARGGGYEATKVHGYGAPPPPGSAVEPQGQVAAPGNGVPYGLTPPPNLAGSGYEAYHRGGNHATPPNLVGGGGYDTQYRGGNPARR